MLCLATLSSVLCPHLIFDFLFPAQFPVVNWISISERATKPEAHISTRRPSSDVLIRYNEHQGSKHDFQAVLSSLVTHIAHLPVKERSLCICFLKATYESNRIHLRISVCLLLHRTNLTCLGAKEKEQDRFNLSMRLKSWFELIKTAWFRNVNFIRNFQTRAGSGN